MDSATNEEELENVGGSGGVPASSRWNPTKEQITMLENLYTQGIKTPTAEEIQQITAKLRVYGHIEGKNVFYWFQNHKARQRQKQKQETIAYFNRLLYRPPPQPFFSPPPIHPNGALYGPYCMPQQQANSEIGGFYPPQQYSKVLLPVANYRNHHHPENLVYNSQLVYEGNNNMQQQQLKRISETLDLFPLQPTGILEGKTTTDKVSSSSLASVSADSSTDTTGSPDINEEDYYACPEIQPFFDFFNSR